MRPLVLMSGRRLCALIFYCNKCQCIVCVDINVQDELVEVVQEQLSCIEDNTVELDKLNARVGELDEVNKSLISLISAKDITIAQLQQVESGSGVAFLEAKINEMEGSYERLYTSKTLESAVLNSTIATKDQVISDLIIADAAKTLEIDALKSTISAKDLTIAQLQLAPQGVGISGNVFVLREELKQAKRAINLNADLAEAEQARADAALLQVQNLQNPTAAGGTFSRIVDVVKAAALATRSGPNYVWNHAECEALVRTMAEGLVAVSRAERTNTVNGMVMQVR